MKYESSISPYTIEQARKNVQDAFTLLHAGLFRVHEHIANSYDIYFQRHLDFPTDTIELLSTSEFWNTVEAINGPEVTTLFQDMDVCAITTKESSPKILLNIEQISTGIEFEVLFAEELLHIYGLQANIDLGTKMPTQLNNLIGNAAMEYIVSYLAYRSLGVFSLPLDSLPEALQGQVSNRLLLHKILNQLPNTTIGYLVEACKTGTSDNLQTHINQSLPLLGEEDAITPYTTFCMVLGILYLFETARGANAETYAKTLNKLVPKFRPYL